jgi:rare lipoprotein A
VVRHQFNGRNTSSGEPYDICAFTAAHKTLPLPSYVRVTNLDNGPQPDRARQRSRPRSMPAA